MEFRGPFTICFIVLFVGLWFYFLILPNYLTNVTYIKPSFKIHQEPRVIIKYQSISYDSPASIRTTPPPIRITAPPIRAIAPPRDFVTNQPRSLLTRRCRGFQSLKKILIAINFNFPHYSAAPLLRKFYEPIFGKVIFCGEKEDLKLGIWKIAENKGYQGYDCVATAIRKFPQFDGYIHSNDDVVLNWWNLLKLDASKIWIGSKIVVSKGHKFGDPIDKTWWWWSFENTAHICEVAFNKVISLEHTQEAAAVDLSRYLKRYYANTNGNKVCVNGWSDVFYIPREYAPTYVYLTSIYLSMKVFLEVTVPTILTFFLNTTNFHDLDGMYYNNIYGYNQKYKSGEAFYETYSFKLNFSHPFKLEGAMKIANRKFFEEVVMVHGQTLKDHCIFYKRKKRKR